MNIQYRNELGKLLDYFQLIGPSAEIGVAEGRFSKEIISWDCVTKHYMIDAWTKLNQKGDGGLSQEWHDDNFHGALKRTDAFAYKREIMRGLTKDMIPEIPDNSLVFAYVDADHSYEGCLRDLQLIWPKIWVGGILAGHDFLNESYGVNRAVNHFVAGTDLKINVIEDEHPSMASFWIQKI